jgi:putative transposase
MVLLSYCRHRFPPPIIQHAIWLYRRFTLSYRDVEDLLAERGLDLSYELQRNLVPRSTLRIFRAEAAPQWSEAVAAA